MPPVIAEKSYNQKSVQSYSSLYRFLQFKCLPNEQAPEQFQGCLTNTNLWGKVRVISERGSLSG
jgi:hypothetical protein